MSIEGKTGAALIDEVERIWGLGINPPKEQDEFLALARDGLKFREQHIPDTSAFSGGHLKKALAIVEKVLAAEGFCWADLKNAAGEIKAFMKAHPEKAGTP